MKTFYNNIIDKYQNEHSGKVPKNNQNPLTSLELSKPLGKGVIAPTLVTYAPYICGAYAGASVKSIVSDGRWKRIWSKHPNYIRRYNNGSFTASNKRKRIDEPYFIEFLMHKIDVTLLEAIGVGKAINMVVEKDSDGNRFSSSTGGSYSKLSYELKSLLFTEFIHTLESGRKVIGYKIKEDSSIDELLNHYIIELDYVDTKHNNNLNYYLKVYTFDFMKMSLYSKLHLLRNTIYCNNFILYVKMNYKQDIGNLGRRYNTLNELARDDRKYISNLYGLDMESAIQVILLTLVEYYDDNSSLSFTSNYILHKQAVREEIAEMMSWSVNDAKMEITAIYQGRWYSKNKYLALEEIFEERDAISEVLFSLIDICKDELYIKYAIKRTNLSLKKKFPRLKLSMKFYKKHSKDSQTHIRNSFMFFLWTYFERKIQNIICTNFKYPLTLHDAVYTQNKDEYDVINISKLEDKLLEETHFPIKLSVE